MMLLYAGYKKVKKKLLRHGRLDGNNVRDILSGKGYDKITMAWPLACDMVLLFIMADDLNVEIIWDFKLMSLYKLIRGMKYEFEIEESETTNVISEENTNILNKVIERFNTCNSVTELLYGVNQEKMLYLIKTMCAFHINPRKFWKYELDKEEINRLLLQKDNWNTKDYMYCMVIAVLCKYIVCLENIVSGVDMHDLKITNEMLELAKEKIIQQEKESAVIFNRLKEKEEEINKRVLDEERGKELLIKQLQDKETRIQEYEQELAELRNYVYCFQDDSEVIQEKKRENSICWDDKKILVLGGHINWQRKLKERFPRWHFLSSDAKTFPIEIIKDKEFIVCNTEILSHKAYYKMLSGRTKQQRILYVHSNNIELCLQELEAQYRNQYCS